MSIKIINFQDEVYPAFQSQGNAAKFAIPFAREVCKGTGYDIGCNRLEWKFDKSVPIDPLIDLAYDAYNLPFFGADYIFSSHCLEHLRDWVEALDYWAQHIIKGGVLFLYLPDFSQKYWRPWFNRKHKHVLTPNIINTYLQDSKQYCNIFISQIDLNNSFMVIAERN